MEKLVDLAHRMGRRTAAVCVVLLALPLWFAGGAAGAKAPVPSWSATLMPYPAFFAHRTAGSETQPPGYMFMATNVGGASTSGEFTVTVSLPAGLEASMPAGGFGNYGSQSNALSCEAGTGVVICRGGEPVLNPGESVQVIVPVEVAAGAFHGVRGEATIAGGGALPVTAIAETPVGVGYPSFGFMPGASGFDATLSEADGAPATQAGSHPYQLSVKVGFPTRYSEGELVAVGGGTKDLSVDLPRGLIADPSVVPARCTDAQLSANQCPPSSQVGTLSLALALLQVPASSTVALYAMVPPPGVPVEFGLELVEGSYLHLNGRLRSDGDYGLTADISDAIAKFPILGATLTLWGNPSDESHDHVRGACLNLGGTCPIEREDAAFLTLPASCEQSPVIGARADSWLEPEAFVERRLDLEAIDGCGALGFDPSISVRPTTSRADSPTGLLLSIQVPQKSGYDDLAPAPLRTAEISLPRGLVLNPAGAEGLGACPANRVAGGCPDASKLGSAEIGTPLVDHPLRGAVYLAKPYDNPSGELLAIYLVIDDPVSGITARLDGRLEADPRDGRLTVSIEEAPMLPIEDVKLELFDQARSFLTTPFSCGTHTTTSRLTPWSSPEGQDATPADSFRTIVAAPGGGACPASEADAPSRPTYSAGSIAAKAGAYTPFVLRMSREVGTQRLSAIDATLPAGVTARLAGIPTCSDPEVTIGHCPAASRVGNVSVTAGAGPSPLPLTGGAYLAGPHKGAPLSLVVLVPALAGPFDLGTLAVRVALFVDPRSAQIHVVSDPLPTILRGIPLDLRELRLDLDRQNFVRNPTSCDPMSVDGFLTTAADKTVPLQSRFQVGGCAGLGFRPRLSLELTGPAHRGAHPSLRAVLRPRPGDANLRRVALTLPPGELLDSRHIRDVCTAALFAAKACSPGSVYGSATVWSPLLDRPLSGPVYLRSSSSRLPELAASLDGEVHVELAARLDARDGQIRVGFGQIPDVPLTKVSIGLAGGRHGLLVNSGALCRDRRVQVSMSAQNRKTRTLRPLVKTSCGN